MAKKSAPPPPSSEIPEEFVTLDVGPIEPLYQEIPPASPSNLNQSRAQTQALIIEPQVLTDALDMGACWQVQKT